MSAVDTVQAWRRAIGSQDFTAARQLARDNLSFRGPIDRFDRVDDYLEALKRLGAIVRGTEDEHLIAAGNQVAVFYVLKTPMADAPVAEWYTVEGDKISRISAYFDARPFAPPPGS